jgi:hypothetical protein
MKDGKDEDDDDQQQQQGEGGVDRFGMSMSYNIVRFF